MLFTKKAHRLQPVGFLNCRVVHSSHGTNGSALEVLPEAGM